MNNSKVTALHLADLKSRDSGAIESMIKHFCADQTLYIGILSNLSPKRRVSINGRNEQSRMQRVPCTRTAPIHLVLIHDLVLIL